MRLVVVGGGPLCTYAIERLAALLSGAVPPEGVAIVVLERTGRFGAGAVHDDLQPASSVMNRVAGQIALGAGEPTFLQWAAERGCAIGAREAPQRRVHGRALREAFERYVALLRGTEGVSVELVAGEAVDVVAAGSPEGDGAPFRVLVAGARGAEELPADRVLCVTGHSWNRPAPGSLADRCRSAPRFVRPAYPLESQLDEATVPPGCTVGLLGLGLTAIDVALYLTEGRGGRFVEGDDDRLGYVPSGREPATLVGACPSGLPVTCRPENAKAQAGTALDHAGVFLTHEAIGALREAVGRPTTLPGGSVRRQLDFDAHVLPLLVLEMAYVHDVTLLGPRAGAAMRKALAPHVRAFVGGGCAGVERLLAPLEAYVAPLLRAGAPRFDWSRVVEPLPAAAARNGAAWRTAAEAFIAQDLARAAAGNLRDPLKAACDGVWRDLRAVLCAAADRGGLTAASQRRFAGVHLRHYNRLSNGAAIEPMRKLLALARAGVLDLSIGPAPAVELLAGGSSFRIRGTATGAVHDVDVLVEARCDPFDAARDARPLYPALLRRGLARLWRNPGAPGEHDFLPGALDLDERFHPRDRRGRVEPRLTFLGAPAEGLVHFGQTAARPHAGSAVLEGVARWAHELVAGIETARAPLAATAR